MAGTLILLYALQSIFGNIPQSIFVVAWVLLVVKLLSSMIDYANRKEREKTLESLRVFLQEDEHYEKWS